MSDLAPYAVTAILWLGISAALLGLAVLCLAFVWRIIRDAWGLKIIFEAIREHEKNHPEKWAKFDRFDLSSGNK